MTTMFDTDSARLITLAEKSEAEFMFQYEAAAPPAVRDELGIVAQRLAGGVVLSMRNDPTGYWSKTVGLGHDSPVTDELIAEVLDLYRSQQVKSATFQFAPSVLPSDWPAIAERHGLVAGGQIVKLAGPIDDIQPPATDTSLRIAPVEATDALTWARMILACFGMPSDGGLAQMLAASIDNPGFQTFAAWDGDEIVAGGNLYVHGEVGSINTGATSPTHRNHGAQSAIIAARIAAATAAGCRWLVAEAGKPPAGASNSSLNNLIRAGLKPLYARTNWNWKNPTAS